LLKVTVIGGAGRMGKWLTHHFVSQGHEVTISDIKLDEAMSFAKSVGARFVTRNVEAVRDADLTVVSAPIPVIPNVLMEVSSQLKKNSVVAEISSLKSQIFPVLMGLADRDVRPLSVHPLFGPGAQKLEEEKVALVPLVNPPFEVELVKKIFPGVEVVVVDGEEHDKAMALTLSLPHFMNIIFASMVCEEDLNVLKKLGGTTFTLQLTLSESVMTEDPGLYTSIQMRNEYTTQYLDEFFSKCKMVKDWIAKEDEKKFTEFYNLIKSLLSRDEDFHRSYERMYKALGTFQNV